MWEQLRARIGQLRAFAQHKVPGLAAALRSVWLRVGPMLAWISDKLRRWFGGFCRGTWFTFRWAARIAGVAFVLFLVAYAFLDTRRDVAYRYAPPGSPACNAQHENASALATPNIDNNELVATNKINTLSDNAAFTCMLQRHELWVEGRRWPNGKPVSADGKLSYDLAFLEYQENGAPVEEGTDGKTLKANQLDVLLDHLRQDGRQNYVIVFIHGWRHNAGIGDGNVQNLRLYAAHAASFLSFRCAAQDQRYCNARVTAVFIGWRGARVDETRLKAIFGRWIGGAIASVLTIPTLSDRKPVSERIGPSVVSALRKIDETLQRRGASKPWDLRDRMLTIGHSLGGNMLASALRDSVVERIAWHEPGTPMQPPIGDLVVLLNPASEAANWTAIQRAAQRRVLLNGNEKQRIDAQNFYPVDQPPVYVSFTAANSWPAGGVRQADYPKLRMRSRPPEWGAVEPSDCQLKTLIPDYRYQSRYDSATHDLFPFFRGDFRPLAEAWEEWAIARCRPKTSAATRVSSQGAGLIVRVLRNIPFMNTDVEQTRTIGHLAPMRPAFGTFAEINTAATTVGTTHEFVINQSTGHPTVYSNAADPRKSECAVVDGWIAAARASAGRRFGTRWDSSYTRKKRDPNVALNVTPVRDRRNYETMTVEKDGKAITKQVAVAGVDHLESQFRHGYVSSGISPIVASNDPFWNIRAFDTGLHDHNGYGFYPLICAIQQLVLDKVAGSSARVVPPPPITPTAPAPSPASAPIENRP